MRTHAHRIGTNVEDCQQSALGSIFERVQGQGNGRGVMGKIIDHAYTVDFGNDFLAAADLVLLCETPNLSWDLTKMAAATSTIVEIKKDTQQIIEQLLRCCQPGDQIVIMSNGGFDGIHQRLVAALQA